ncbi:deoxynucleotidyltransferase terminal-interacting protein 2 isoform X2 [Clupea harengus]|uniref:Deoxynucleotidyltransferase terminal-interacting protein 2 isoform X2 n=1 Tax=Clupea harengus TaxID=7950 RepID=A0A6P8G568_CLUHA|nr:deoxynucleotidyltransferase terminal-interacting protein 2 isoform X2 [Clupea harengus]
MVATRRGVRVVESPTKTNQDESSSSSGTATSTRRTRRVTVLEEAQTPSSSKSDAQKAENEVTSTASTQEEKSTEEATACVENQSEDIHDADVSDSESCCSVVSGAQTPSTRSTRKRGRPATLRKPTSGTEGVSEAESYTSSVSATPGRFTRSQKKKVLVGSVAADEEPSEAESCSSVTSRSKRGDARVLTRSQRKTAASHTEDTEHSEQDSYDQCKSTVRKSTRGRRPKPVLPVPIDFEDSGDVSSSSVSRRTPARRAKAAPSSEARSHVSEDNESRPSTRRTTRGRTKDTRGTSDSESDLTGYSPLGSPCSLLARSTPCSSRTGSASSTRGVLVTRSLHIVAARVTSPLLTKDLAPNQGDGDAPVSDAMETGEEMEVEGHEATVIVTGEEEEACLLVSSVRVAPLHSDVTLVSPPLPTDDQAPNQGERDAPVSDAMETGEGHEATVIVTGEEREASLLTEVSEEDQTLIAMEEEEDSVGRGVTVVDPAELAAKEDTHTVSPSVVVTESVCPDTERAEEINSIEDEHSEKEASKGSVTVSEEAGENIESGLGSVGTLTTPCADSVTVTVSEMAEEDTLEGVTEGNDQLLTATDACSDQTAKVTVHEPSMAELGNSTAEVVHITEEVAEENAKPHIATEFDVPGDKTVDHTEVSESLADTSSRLDIEVSAQDGVQPSGSGPSQTLAAVSLLDSSDDDDEEEDNEEPVAAQEASESEDDEASGSEAALTARTKPKAKARLLPSDGLFVIDTQPGLQSSQKYYAKEEEQEEDVAMEEFVDEEDEEEDEDTKVLFTSRDPASKELSCSIDPGLKVKELGGLYINFDGSKSKKVSSGLKKLKDQKHLDELMKKSVVGPDFEKKDSIPPYKESLNASKLKRREERAKTTGDGWFNMKAPEMTEELKNDLKAIQMRSAMDPKRFYKKNDREGFSKYLQVGTVVDSPIDFYHSRIPKKQRKKTIVEELLADAQFRSYNKRKYQEIMTEKAALLAGKKHGKKKFKSKK